MPSIRSCFVTAFALFFLAAGPIMADDLAAVSTDASGIYFLAKSAHHGYELTVGGPDGSISKQVFEGGASPAFQVDGGHADGSYTWELKAIAAPRDRGRDQAVARQALVQSGSFSVAGGAVVTGGEEQAAPVESGPLAKAQTFTTDLIVQGSACVGVDCSSGESFGFDTLRLKENNLRIKFDDTSASGSFPNNDWQLTANDSNNGGANRFSIDDVTNGKTPFTVQANAPNNALVLEASTGDVGMGTANPAVELHVVDGDSPTLRLEQDGSSGFTAQTWDIAGNETNFFVRDVTNGSKLPFKIKPGAPDNALFVAASGDLGVGHTNPDAPVHVARTDGSAQVKVVDTSGNDTTLLTLESAGVARFSLKNASASNYRFTSANNGDLVINLAGGGTNPLTLTSAGNLTVTGTVTPMSDKNAKENFEAIDAADVLDRLLEMPITLWNYKADDDAVRHLGPMAQDFFRSFGLGDTDTGISVTDSAGVAFAAIQALHSELSEKTEEVEAVKARNGELETRIAALEHMVEAIAASN